MTQTESWSGQERQRLSERVRHRGRLTRPRSQARPPLRISWCVLPMLALLGMLVGAGFTLRPGPPAPAPALKGALVAHRAGLAHAPENSLLAVDRAAAAGADAVEIDVRWGPAGELVGAHDAAQAPSADALSALLDRALGHGLMVELDLKTGALGDRALVREVVRLVQAREARARVWVSAFQPVTAWQVRWEDPDLALGWPMAETGLPWLDALVCWEGFPRWLGASVLEPEEGLATEERLARWSESWPIEIWGIDDPPRAAALRERGFAVVVDAIPSGEGGGR